MLKLWTNTNLLFTLSFTSYCCNTDCVKQQKLKICSVMLMTLALYQAMEMGNELKAMWFVILHF